MNTVRFIGILNRLSDEYNRYGVKPLSKTRSSKDYFFGIVYDDTKEEFDECWHKYPIINGMDGKSYNEIFPNVRFEVAWSNDPDNCVSIQDPNIWVYNDDCNFCCHIEKSGWYV